MAWTVVLKYILNNLTLKRDLQVLTAFPLKDKETKAQRSQVYCLKFKTVYA